MLFRNVAIIGLVVFAASTARGTTNPGTVRMPFAFVENRGQSDARVRYIGVGSEFKVWFEDRGVILQHGGTAVRISFLSRVPQLGVNPVIRAENPIGATASYMRGNDPRLWQTSLPLFDTISYTGIWPGIELKYQAERSRVKAEYIVAPGADASRIRLRFDGHARVEDNGTLRVRGLAGDFVEEKPVLYQSIHGERIEVDGGFQRLADGSIGFWMSGYDRTQPLVIDPSILFSGYFGGSSQDTINAMAVDGLNNVVVAGWTSSTDLPSTNGARPHYAGSVDAFVASFLPDGGPLRYCTYLGGSGDDQAFGLAIDSLNNVYITGWTQSANFPVVAPLQAHLSGTRDAFVTKLNAAGNSLIYSTYLGGSAVDSGFAIAVDTTGHAAVIGDTTSKNLPVTPGAFQPQLNGSQDVFVAKLSPAGNALTVMTYFGGSAVDHGAAIAVNSASQIYFGGYTWSTNFPTATPFQPKSGGGQDGFVAELQNDGTQLKHSTYLGGSGGSVGAPEEVNAITVSSAVNIVVAGTTSSANFPVTPGAFQTVFGGQTDGFVTLINRSWSMVTSTFLGGALSDGINAMACDFYDECYVTGFTSSQDFPVQNPLQNANAGGMDAFVFKLNTSLFPVFGTYLGGSGSDQGNAIAVDNQTSIIVAGQTSSGNLPVAGSLQTSPEETLSSFITKIAPNFTLGVAYGYQGQLAFTADPWHVASYVASTVYGLATDLPIVGDWTGTGMKRIGIFRNGTWILDTNGNGILDASDKTVSFGQAGDIPVVGDWRGVGQIALGLFRQGTFILDLSGHLSGVPTGLSDATFTFGQAGDIPIVADWSGSGTAKVGVFLNGNWLVDYTGGRVVSGLNRSYVYGQAGDLPVVGDWDSSGNPPKIGIYRGGIWILNYAGNNIMGVPGLTEMLVGFGIAGYTPLVF
jgi:hypothetical protein